MSLKMHIQQYDMRFELLGSNTSRKAAAGYFYLILGFIFKDFFQNLDDVLLAVYHEQHPRATGHQLVERHAVMLHEPDQLIQRNPPILAARNPDSRSKRPRIEPFAHGTRRDVTNLRHFTRGQYIFQFVCSLHVHFLPDANTSSVQAYISSPISLHSPVRRPWCIPLPLLISTSRLSPLLRMRSFCRPGSVMLIISDTIGHPRLAPASIRKCWK